MMLDQNTQGGPVWNLTGGDGNIFQERNSVPSVAVGDISFSDVDYEGAITVEVSTDHDFVGVVFSFQVKIVKLRLILRLSDSGTVTQAQ